MGLNTFNLIPCRDRVCNLQVHMKITARCAPFLVPNQFIITNEAQRLNDTVAQSSVNQVSPPHSSYAWAPQPDAKAEWNKRVSPNMLKHRSKRGPGLQ